MGREKGTVLLLSLHSIADRSIDFSGYTSFDPPSSESLLAASDELAAGPQLNADVLAPREVLTAPLNVVAPHAKDAPQMEDDLHVLECPLGQCPPLGQDAVSCPEGVK